MTSQKFSIFKPPPSFSKILVAPLSKTTKLQDQDHLFFQDQERGTVKIKTTFSLFLDQDRFF